MHTIKEELVIFQTYKQIIKKIIIIKKMGYLIL